MADDRIIAAFDVSTSRTGVAIGPAGGKPRAFVWPMGDKDAPLWERHARLASNMGELLNVERPYLVVIEAPLDPTAEGVTTNFNTAMALIGGACVAAAVAKLCGCSRIKFAHVQKIRKAFIGRARLPKTFDPIRKRQVSGSEAAKQAVMAHCRMLGWQVEDHNAGDACAAWSWGLGQLNPLAAAMTTPLFGRAA